MCLHIECVYFEFLNIECVYFELIAQNMFNLDMQLGVVVTEF